MITNGGGYYPSPYASTLFPNFTMGSQRISPNYGLNYQKNQEKPSVPPVTQPKIPSIPSFKFYDLDTSSRNELIRLIFSYAGVSYKGKRFKQEEWEKIKGQLPFEQLPILRVNKQFKIFHFHAIISYLAREFRLYGADQRDHAIVDMIVQTIRPLQEEIFERFHSSPEQKQTIIEQSTNYLNQLEKFYEFSNRSGPFYLGTQISLADLIVYNTINPLIQFNPKLLENYSHLRDARRRLEKNPNISRYLHAKTTNQREISDESQRHPTKSSTSNTSSHDNHRQHRHRSNSHRRHHHHHHHHHHRHRLHSKETTPPSQTKRSIRSSKSSSVSKKNREPSDIIPAPPPIIPTKSIEQ